MPKSYQKMTLSNQEKLVFKKGYQIVAGIDEVGRGCLAGPVAAAVAAVSTGLSRSFRSLAMTRIRDSKQLSAKQREEIFEIIKNEPKIEWRVSFVWPKVIDRINIWQATLLAWQRSLKKLNPQPDFLFLDGKLAIPRLKIAQRPIIKGDQKIFLLSLASIMAKVSRDRLMQRLDKVYPQYGFAQHKGYGTKLHFENLKKSGPCSIHRNSFRPVFENLPFSEKVYYLVSQIPRGQVVTYQELAQKIGQPRAYRAVGNVLNKNTNPQIPCHRVIRSDGRLGGYSRGSKIKERLLKREGIKI
jgi:ribonuclease HII